MDEQTSARQAGNEPAAAVQTDGSKPVPFGKKPLPPRLAYYLRVILPLFIITAAVAILLALVNLITKPLIDRQAEEKRLAALSQVMPDAQYETITALPEGIDGLVSMTRATQDGSVKGYCVQVTANGYSSMELMVGVDAHGAITGVSFLSMSETPGVGTKVKTEPWFLQQFLGRSGETVSNIQPISGATTTSSAVTAGVNSALKAVSAYQKGGLS